jgi:tRNA modification GTPase
MEMTLSKMADSDIILLVLDQSSSLDERDLSIIERILQKNVITVLNKSDLPQRVSDSAVHNLLPAAHIVRVSALLHQGIDTLEQAIGCSIVHDLHELPSHALVTHTRHKRALENIHGALAVALDGLKNGRALELVAIDLRTALDAVGHLTGETVTDDILDTIFSRFCIGK